MNYYLVKDNTKIVVTLLYDILESHRLTTLPKIPARLNTLKTQLNLGQATALYEHKLLVADGEIKALKRVSLNKL